MRLHPIGRQTKRELGKKLEVSKKAAIEAGKEIMKVYNCEKIDVQYKDDRSPLTEADRQATKVVVDILSVVLPDYAISCCNERFSWLRRDG